MLNFYKITKFDYDNPNYHNDWINMSNFAEQKGSADFADYFFWENGLVDVYMSFCHFSETTLMAKIFDEDLEDSLSHLPNYLFDNLEFPFSDYKSIRNTSFDKLNDNQKKFIIRCHIREICTIHLVSTNGAFLKPMGDSFYAQLGLYESTDIWNVINIETSMFVYHDFDQHNENDAYEVPKNYGFKVFRCSSELDSTYKVEQEFNPEDFER